MNNKPQTGKKCLIHTVDGRELEAVWIDRINKYTPCRRWRRTEAGLSKKERWLNDSEVISWKEIEA